MRVSFLPAFRPLFDPSLRGFHLWGGRNGGRTHAASRKVVMEASQRPMKWACVRWNANATDRSQRPNIRAGIEEFGLVGNWRTPDSGDFVCGNGSRIMFLGLYGSKGQRSLEDIDGVWLEEAQYMANPEFGDFLRTVLRKTDADGRSALRVIVTGNPQFDQDPAYEWSLRQSRLEHGTLIHTTMDDLGTLASEDMIEQRAADYASDPDLADHDWKGVTIRDSSLLKVVSHNWLEAAIAGYAEQRKRFADLPSPEYGLDPSDGGGDDCVSGRRRGPFCESLRILTQPPGRIGDALTDLDAEARSLGAMVMYYDDGAAVGADVSTWFLEQKPPYQVIAVPFGGAALGPRVLYGRIPNNSVFRTQQVQMGWNLRDRFRAAWLIGQGDDIDPRRGLWLSPEAVKSIGERKLTDQVTQPEWKRVEERRIVLEKSPRELPSPDVFDALRLCYRRSTEGGLTALPVAPKPRERELPRGF